MSDREQRDADEQQGQPATQCIGKLIQRFDAGQSSANATAAASKKPLARLPELRSRALTSPSQFRPRPKPSDTSAAITPDHAPTFCDSHKHAPTSPASVFGAPGDDAILGMASSHMQAAGDVTTMGMTSQTQAGAVTTMDMTSSHMQVAAVAAATEAGNLPSGTARRNAVQWRSKSPPTDASPPAASPPAKLSVLTSQESDAAGTTDESLMQSPPTDAKAKRSMLPSQESFAAGTTDEAPTQSPPPTNAAAKPSIPARPDCYAGSTDKSLSSATDLSAKPIVPARPDSFAGITGSRPHIQERRKRTSNGPPRVLHSYVNVCTSSSRSSVPVQSTSTPRNNYTTVALSKRASSLAASAVQPTLSLRADASETLQQRTDESRPQPTPSARTHDASGVQPTSSPAVAAAECSSRVPPQGEEMISVTTGDDATAAAAAPP
eukprot:scpid61580/ scgid16071/ 